MSNKTLIPLSDILLTSGRYSKLKYRNVFVCLLVFSLLALSGCAQQRSTAWYKQSLTQQEWARDRYECQRDATYTSTPQQIYGPLGYGMIGSMPVGGGTRIDQSLYSRCLQARGYQYIYTDTLPGATGGQLQDDREGLQYFNGKGPT